MHAKVRAVDAQLNNSNTLLLMENDKFVQSITPLTGLDSILSLAYQSLAIVARMPAVKLLGLSPQGLNNTGEFDMKNYYDEIEGYQKSILQPLIVNIAERVLWSLGYDYRLDFTFIPIAQESNLEKVQREATHIQNIDNLLTSGLLSPDQAFSLLQMHKVIPASYEFTVDNNELNLNE